MLPSSYSLPGRPVVNSMCYSASLRARRRGLSSRGFLLEYKRLFASGPALSDPALERTRGSAVGVRLTFSGASVFARAAQRARGVIHGRTKV